MTPDTQKTEREEFTTSDRGFKFMEPVTCTYGSTVGVSESSAAMAPHIWLRVSEDPNVLTRPEKGQAGAHLTLEQAGKLRDQLDWLIKNHYQVHPDGQIEDLQEAEKAEADPKQEESLEELIRWAIEAECDYTLSGYGWIATVNDRDFDGKTLHEALRAARQAMEAKANG